MGEKITGGCLCGKVAFRVDNQFQQLYRCYCSQCRKITGSAYASNLFTQSDKLEWLTGQENIRRFDHPGRDFSKAFCADCGCGVPFVNKSGSLMIVPPGSLDSDPDIVRQTDIFWSERTPWSEAGADHFDKFPE